MAVVEIPPGPFPGPSITNDLLTVSVFLNSPPLVRRRVEQISEINFVTPQLFGKGPDTNAGAVAYDQVTKNDLYLTRSASKIAPGAEFPLGTDELPIPKIASIDKWGERVKIPLEAVIRDNWGAVDRAFTKLANTIVQKVDQVGIQTLKDAPTLDYTFNATWAGSDINAILEGLIGARRKSIQTKMGYRPNTLILNTEKADRLFVAAVNTDKKLFGEQAQADKIINGYVGRLLNFDIFATEEIDAADSGWLVEKGVVGDISDERPLNTKSYYRDENESWFVQGSRSFVPYVTDPNAAIELIGI